MRVLVAFSGGKDSLASLIWAKKQYPQHEIEAVFCDTSWEHMLLYPYIKEVTDKLGVKLVTLRGQYTFMELAKKKGRFPSTMARFCTKFLKVRPFIDYLLSIPEHCVVIQGIRADESTARSLMEPHCTYFKYYKQPYGHDLKTGKPKFYTYRKADVLTYDAMYEPEIERPVFDKTAVQVINDILEAELKPCPLYYFDFGRVGCAPCIHVTHFELYALINHFPTYEQKLIDAEIETGSSFFPPKYIPKRFHDKSMITKKGKTKTFASARAVIGYIRLKNSNGKLHPDVNAQTRSCMTAFNICE